MADDLWCSQVRAHLHLSQISLNLMSSHFMLNIFLKHLKYGIGGWRFQRTHFMFERESAVECWAVYLPNVNAKRDICQQRWEVSPQVISSNSQRLILLILGWNRAVVVLQHAVYTGLSPSPFTLVLYLWHYSPTIPRTFFYHLTQVRNAFKVFSFF